MAFVNGGSFRLQIYDDGAGMYLFDAPLDTQIGAGNMNAASGLAGAAVGPFILPSPCPVTAPGLLTVQLSNVNTPLNEGFALENSVDVALALVFAVPKRCKGAVPNGMRQIRMSPRGIVS
jgi:hypothetical protein